MRFNQPVRDVRLTGTASPEEAGSQRRQAETDAFERGRLEGERALSEQLLQQRTELLAVHQGVLESLRAAIPKISQDTEKALVEIALEAAQRIVAGMPIDAKTVESVVREAVGQVEDTTDITIQLHPEDLSLLRKHQSPILRGLPEAGPVRFATSAEISRGGCMIHTHFGLLDARRETKIAQLRNSLVP